MGDDQVGGIYVPHLGYAGNRVGEILNSGDAEVNKIFFEAQLNLIPFAQTSALVKQLFDAGLKGDTITSHGLHHLHLLQTAGAHGQVLLWNGTIFFNAGSLVDSFNPFFLLLHYP